MRAAPSFLAVLGTLACTIDNPGFFVTDGQGGSGTATTTGDVATTGRTTTDATTDATTHGTTPTSTSASTSASTSTTGPDSTSTTAPATTGPLTGTASDTGDDTTGDTSTSDGNTTLDEACRLPVAPTYELGFSTNKNFLCAFNTQYLFYAEPIAPDGPNAWKMRVCTDVGACKSGDACPSTETVRLAFDGPAEFVPKLDNAACHQIGLIARGPDQNDPTICRLRILRLGHAAFDVPAEDYVGAVGVTSTDTLPLPWPAVLNFSVAPELTEPCDGEPACNGVPPGVHQLKMHWHPTNKDYAIPEGGSVGESFDAKKGGNPITLFGSFTNIKSHAEPGGTCDDGLHFAFVWFGELLAAP